MLAEEIKRRMFAAMKAKKVVEKEILRVILGEIQTVQARGTEPVTDAVAAQIVSKLVKSNEESLAATSDAEQSQVLREEIAILKGLLPTALDVEQIIEALAPVQQQIVAAKASGPATGIAMKHLKGQALNVDGKDVAVAVARLRSESPAL
jgi:uncharacterized protein YqeY